MPTILNKNAFYFNKLQESPTSIDPNDLILKPVETWTGLSFKKAAFQWKVGMMGRHFHNCMNTGYFAQYMMRLLVLKRVITDSILTCCLLNPCARERCMPQCTEFRNSWNLFH